MTKRLTNINLHCGKIAEMFQVEIQGYTYVKIDCV